MTSFEVESRRAVSSSISVFTCHILHQNVDNHVVYHDANRDVDTMTGSYQKDVLKSGLLARRLVSWFFLAFVCRKCCFLYIMFCSTCKRVRCGRTHPPYFYPAIGLSRPNRDFVAIAPLSGGVRTRYWRITPFFVLLAAIDTTG